VIIIKKFFFTQYLDQYFCLNKNTIGNKLLNNNQFYESKCGKISIQLYTRELFEELFYICCQYINKKIEIDYNGVNIKTINNTKQTTIFWIEHIKNKEVLKLNVNIYHKYDNIFLKEEKDKKNSLIIEEKRKSNNKKSPISKYISSIQKK